jgi:phosphatidylglycerol lysyltransferase
VVGEFEADAKSSGERVCYFAAESRLEEVLGESDRHSKFLLGAQPSWHPAAWPKIVAAQKSLRAQINRARNKGVTVEEWPREKAHDHPLLRRCLKQWLDSKGLPPLHFMVEPDTLCRLEDRRIFVGTRGGEVVGFVLLSPVAKRNGWLFEQFPHMPGAPNGTVELMIDTAMRAIAADGAEYATLGLSPLSTRADVAPFDNPLWLKFALAWMRKHGRRFYNFDGLDAFKAKLRPEKWEPVFAVSNEKKVSLRALYAIASAFSGHAPFRLVFGGLWRAVAVEAKRAEAKVMSIF